MLDLSQDVPDRLPLLDALVAERTEGAPLSGVTAVLIQHQLGSIVPMVRALIELGLEPGRAFFVDIPYTANAEVRAALEGLGLPAAHFALGTYHLEQPYAAYQRRRVQDLAADVLGELRADEPVLVLDDGAYFVEAASCFARSFGDLRVVEQTTRGIIKLRADAAMAHYVASLPLVDVARSTPKARWEGPWIGEAVCHALHRALGDEFAVGPDERALVTGYGVIGRAVAASLIRELGIAPARIHVLDPSPAAQLDAVADGFLPWDRASAEPVRFKLVVGCSGRPRSGSVTASSSRTAPSWPRPPPGRPSARASSSSSSPTRTRATTSPSSTARRSRPARSTIRSTCTSWTAPCASSTAVSRSTSTVASTASPRTGSRSRAR